MGSCISCRERDQGASPSPLESQVTKRLSISSSNDERRRQKADKTKQALAQLRVQRADELEAKYAAGLIDEATYVQLKPIESRRRLTLKLSHSSLTPHPSAAAVLESRSTTPHGEQQQSEANVQEPQTTLESDDAIQQVESIQVTTAVVPFGQDDDHANEDEEDRDGPPLMRRESTTTCSSHVSSNVSFSSKHSSRALLRTYGQSTTSSTNFHHSLTKDERRQSGQRVVQFVLPNFVENDEEEDLIHQHDDDDQTQQT
ncbi:Hypothetical protein, putative [Bodo saltans]|uniref:Uncharacterized protein n=1 Tax=Bodo saltans TaxID=75058 RepID=A0A0S4IPU9_BODSA|nr:Hypothetical protein, putative [Bodo saltans]|eukprot:CUE70030.1 Hypothetical protein, putative [Bodo saltans]